MKKFLILFTSLLLIASCSTQRFSVNNHSKRQNPQSNPHFTQTSHFFFGGLDQQTHINSSELCKDLGGVAFVETKLTFAQGLFTGLTYGVYAPRTNNIYCNKQD